MGSGLHEEEMSSPEVSEALKDFARHDLLEVSEKGRKEVACQAWDVKGLLKASSWQSPSVRGHCKRVLEYGLEGVCIPGIVRRFTDSDIDSARELYGDIEQDDFVAVGFVISFMPESRRIRVPCVLHHKYVTGRTTPEQVAAMTFAPRTPALAALSVMKESVKGEVKLGVWGSGALEIYTGLPYTDGRSDLDVVLMGASIDDVRNVVELADRLEKSFLVRIDVEVQLDEGWGVNGRELVSGRDTVLVKGIREVKLAMREDLLRYGVT